MKNKFLVMAIVTSLFAFTVLPAALAQSEETPVETEITSNQFSINCYNDLSTGMDLSTLSAVPTSDATVTYSGAYADDYCELVDYDATAGARVTLKMSSVDSGNFVYAGTAGGNNIDVERMLLIANQAVGSNIAADKGLDDNTKTLNIISATTAQSARSATLYTFDPSFTSEAPYAKAASSSAFNYITSTADAPYVINFGLKALSLSIPALSAPGTYTSTLVITIVPGAV